MSGTALSGKRVKIEKIKKLVTELFKTGFKDVVKKYEICGSYRREKED